jgi:hypothetical protein
MKNFAMIPAVIGTLATAAFAEVPEVLSFLPPGQLVKGATIRVVPPEGLDPYVAKVEASARENPEWFEEHAKSAPPGVPLPYDPKLGLTREEYDEYLGLWQKREFKAVEPIVLRLRSAGENQWTINTAGGAHQIATLKYDAAEDVFRSPNGTLERIEDIKAEQLSILGEWSGHEWRFEEETSLGKTKENFAIGKTGDGNFGMLVYRMQEMSSEGTPLYDTSIVIRFALGEAGYLKPEDVAPGNAPPGVGG